MSSPVTRKGTNAGSRNGMHKLTEDAVRDIIEKHQHGRTQKDLACDYGVSKAAVCMITRGRRWKHLRTAA